MDGYELAGMLFGHKRAESDTSERPRDLTISGVAESDSADGLVSISLDGDLTQAEDDGLEHDHSIVIPTEVGVYAGDEVAVTLTGADLSTLRVTGVVGDGDRVNARISGIEADYVKATELEADVADIGFLKADSAVITDIQADTAKVHSLTAQGLSAATGYVGELQAGNVSAQDIVAGKATVGELVADHVSVSDFQAEQANIDSLQAATADIATIRANSAKVQNLTAAQLEADHATIGTLDTTYMHADMANADVAWISNGTIRDGAIVSAMINDVSANKLTAGTINGSVINVTNLNADNITAGTINGQRIGQGSLSLDKLSEDVYTEAEVDTIVNGLNDRIDGAIETFTGTAVPTLNNQPASSWTTTKLRDEHVGDVYYVVNSQSQQNGYCYRFTKSGSTYSWQLIKDSDVTAALSRLTTAEGKITSIESFDSTVSSFMTNTDSELTSVKSRATSLETRMTDAEGDISEKVDTSTFNTLSQTVDENSASITSMSTVISNNGLTSSTNITNTVNTVSQTASGNSSKIAQLTTTLGTNADGTTKAGDVVHRTSAIEQDVSSFKTTVSETYATQTALATTNGNVTAAQTAADNAATAASNAQTTANTANNKQVAFSATSSTGATTAAKVAACTNFPALVAGATVTVRFSAANTSTGAITLNVNSTGAKTVYVNGSATSSSNQLLWGVNANITFTYDGSYWRVDSEPRTWYGTGGVAAATAAKTATVNEVVICKGTTVVLNMTYENTSESATLNVTSTGAKNIYYGTTTTRPTTSNGYGWGAGSTVSLTFDGQYWRIGDTTALARLTAAESTLSSHSTSISQNANAIALKADSSTTYTKTDVDGLITTEVTNRDAAITAKANEITSTVSQTYTTKEEFNNLEIGGRNLLYNTLDWSSWACTPKATVSDGVLTTTNTDTSAFQRANGWFTLDKADIVDRVITISFEAKKTDATALSTLCFQLFTTSAAPKSVTSGNIPEGTRCYVNLSVASTSKVTIENATAINATTWTKVTITFKPSEVLNASYTEYEYLAMYVGISNKVGSAQYRRLKAEFANRASDWTPAPEDIETRVSSAESAITQNASDIALKVSESDVTGNYIVGKINLDSTTASIAAQHINLQGAVTISDLASDAQNATLNSNISVGGRNYILNSAGTLVSCLGSAAGSRKEYQFLNVGQSYMDIPHGTQVTISFDLYMTVNTANPTIQVYNTNNRGPKAFSYSPVGNGTAHGITKSFTATAGSVIDERVSVTGYINDRTSPSLSDNFLEFYSNYGSSNWFSISNLKLEKGNTSTDWTSAPEDVDSAISDAAKTATSYVTDITGGGIMVHPSGDQTTGVQITDDVDILRDGTSVINIGTDDAVRVGSASGGHIAIDSDSMGFWASAEQLAMRFTGQIINNPKASVYFAQIMDGVTRENDDPYTDKSYISLYTREEPTYEGSDEKVVTESMATMHAYAREGTSAGINVFVDREPNASTASRGAIIASDKLTCEGTTNVGDPYGSVDGLTIGSPTRVTSSKSCTALTNDTMGPNVALTAGKWLIMGNWGFTNTSSSAKRLSIGLYRNATGSSYTWRVHTTAPSSTAHKLEVVDTIVLTSDEVITLYASSSPASTSASTQWITAVRLS